MNKLPVAIIPAYKPMPVVINIAQELIESNAFQGIICINDGSGKEYDEIFNELINIGVKVEYHAVNLGKGTALKTGFNAALHYFPESCGPHRGRGSPASCPGRRRAGCWKRPACPSAKLPNSAASPTTTIFQNSSKRRSASPPRSGGSPALCRAPRRAPPHPNRRTCLTHSAKRPVRVRYCHASTVLPRIFSRTRTYDLLAQVQCLYIRKPRRASRKETRRGIFLSVRRHCRCRRIFVLSTPALPP